MGYNLLYELVLKKLNISFIDSDLLELGDQDATVYDTALGRQRVLKLRDAGVFNAVNRYVVYDLHPREGVTVYDLSEPHETYEKFDRITNFGTTEHVEPEKGQYNCWLNVHNLLKINGMIINIVPCSDGGWPGHCRYYYNEPFFQQFKNIGYDLVFYGIAQDLKCVSVLRKREDSRFLEEEEFWKHLVIKRENNSDVIYHDNNPKGLKF